MASKKPKTTTKVTEIDDAKVKIEVEELEGKEAENKSADAASASTADDSEKESPENKEEVADEEEVENFDEESSGRFSWKKVILFTLIAALFGAIIVGGYLYLQGGYQVKIVKVDKQAEKSLDIPEVSPTPTEAPISKEKYEITVLNGSGIEGEAASVEELLEDEGFVVAEIGNADNQAYLETEIRAGEEVDEEYLEELEEALNVRGPTEIEEAPDAQTEEVVVVVGSELADPDASPTPLLE